MLRLRQLMFILLLPMISKVGWSQAPAQRTTLPVKQFEEFLKRFYYEQTPDQQPLTTDSLRALYPRRAYLLSLFDAKDGRRTSQPAYNQAVDAFVTEMAESTERPTDLYENVIAETPFRVTYRGKADVMTACWQMVRIGRAQGWRLVGLTAPFLAGSKAKNRQTTDTLAASIPDDTISLPSRPSTMAPNAHETSFLAFHNAVQEGQDLQLVLSDSLRQTAVGKAFIRTVRRRELVITETERVTLFVPTRSGWVVRVDEFPRDDDNSGWLISDLYGSRSPSKIPVGLAYVLALTP